MMMEIVLGILFFGAACWVVWESEQILQEERDRRNGK
jgi:hypothetical protein